MAKTRFHEYLRETGQKIGSFARRIGISPNYLSEIATYRKTPSLETAHKIEVATNGAIPMSFWLDRPNAERGSGQSK
jgi:DNA-binding transcriptional regulator YdaS (Cro superfamily)